MQQQHNNNNTLQLQWKLNNNNKEKNNNSSKSKRSQKSNNNSKNNKNYALRAGSIQKRIEVEHRKKEPKKRGPKPRPRPQPMSKYRRKTANLRERERMGEINNAFERLRAQIPAPIASIESERVGPKLEKMTKINILHVTINYIKALESILDTGDAGVQVYGTSVVQSPFIPLPKCAETILTSSVENKTSARPKKIRRKNSVNLSKVDKIKKRTKKPSSSGASTTSTASSSSSEDSGISLLEADSDMAEVKYEADYDESDFICPDWTELTSTLEFPYTDTKPQPVIAEQPAGSRGNLDTLLASTAAMSSHITPTPRPVLQPINKQINRQISFPDLGGCGDLFSDLNSSFDSMEEGISFVTNDDPFELVF